MIDLVHRTAALRPAPLLAAALCCLAGCATAPATAPSSLAGATLVDLSHGYDADTIYWPTEPDFALEVEADGTTPGGYYYASNRFATAEHGGTHIDAPRHFAAGRRTVEQVPLAQLVGPAVRIDVRAACAADRDHRVTVAELEAWERAHGEIAPGTIVLIDTGFARAWPDRERYLGTEARGAAGVAELRFPGLHADAARWLVDERRIHAVGIDTASIDYGRSKAFEAHRVLMAANVPAFENLAALDALPARGFDVVALPMKIVGGSGAPLRVVAVLPADR